jgi:phenylacetate-CoA ligase
MVLWPILRSVRRYSRGERPRVEDLNAIVRYLRRRRERGLPVLSLEKLGRLPAWSRGDPVQKLEALQTRKPKATVAYAYRYVPFYRQAMDSLGVKAGDIRSLADIHKLPVTRREHLSEDTEAFISQYPGLVATTVSWTGGTTGKRIQAYLTSDEFEFYTASEALGALLTGIFGPADILQIHFTMDRAIEAKVLTSAARKAGALVLTYGTEGTLDDHLESILTDWQIPGKKPKVSFLGAAPSHLWALTRRAEEKGYDFRDSGLERIVTGGAMVGEDLKRRVKETWGDVLSEGYGLGEVLPCALTQCGESDRLHFPDTTGYAEVLDATTEEPVLPGEPGILTITTFYPDREYMPLLRYWTEDVVAASPDRTCVCGLAATQILDVIGRADHMVKVGSRSFYPQEIGDALLAFDDVVLPPRFTLRTEQREDAQYVFLDVEHRASLPHEGVEELCKRISDRILLSQFWLVKVGVAKLVVNLHPAGSLQHPFAYRHRHLTLAQRPDEPGDGLPAPS